MAGTKKCDRCGAMWTGGPDDDCPGCEADGELDQAEGHDDRARMQPGGGWILDAPENPEPIVGRGSEVMWSRGESMLLVGPTGTGKTTVIGQIIASGLGILEPEFLGMPVAPVNKVLYLAMDRPNQIRRSLRRLVDEEHRQILDERLVVWQGPPMQDFAADQHVISVMAANAGLGPGDWVIVDSLKDAAVKLADDETGSRFNRARQQALADGFELLEGHHQRKGQNGSKPKALEDVYGSTWITAGAGSVVLLWGEAGDLVVELSHLKQPAEPIGPMRILHDHPAGRSSVVDGVDLVALAASSEWGLTVRDAARAIFEKDSPDRNETEKARRRLDRFTEAGQLVRGVGPKLNGGKPPTVYRVPSSNHEPNHGEF